jgi:mono/diheme cytochrome c family protein
MYEKQCAACHGSDGRGKGEAAYLLYPKPRDFVRARYRLVSTWEGTPTDHDLFNTISRGIPGSSMPSWGYLPERTRWGLVHYIKAFAEQPLVVQPDAEPSQADEVGTGVISVPLEPPFTPEARAQAEDLFREACASCHGSAGRGDGPDAAQLVDTVPGAWLNR